MVAELEVLEKAIEGRQFVAHANSILETEATTEKVVFCFQMPLRVPHFLLRWLVLIWVARMLGP